MQKLPEIREIFADFPKHKNREFPEIIREMFL